MGELLVAGRLWQLPYLEQLQTEGLDAVQRRSGAFDPDLIACSRHARPPSTEPAEAASRIVAPER
jgi:hypothetical protein